MSYEIFHAVFLHEKTYLQARIRVAKNSVFGQNLFWEHFLLRSSLHFWNQYKKADCLIPDLFKEKSFNLVYFLWTKKSKKKASTQYFVTVFNKQVLDSHHPSKILVPDIWASKSLVSTSHFISSLSFYPSSLHYALLNEWVKFSGKIKKGCVIIPDANITW